MRWAAHGAEREILRHEPAVVGASLGTVYVTAFNSIDPDGGGGIRSLISSLMTCFEYMEVRVARYALVDPTVKVESTDPVAVVTEEPVAAIGGDDSLVVTARITRDTKCGVALSTPINGIVVAEIVSVRIRARFE